MNRIRPIVMAVILGLSASMMVACGGDTSTTESATTLPEATANAGEAPVITPPAGAAPAVLMTKDVIVGNGTEVQAASTLTVHYVLMTWSDGQVVESSWAGGQPATFPLATLIEGWQQGLPGAKIGGRRLLIVPPELGYGASGSGPIGPNETLVFVVDVIDVL